MNLGNTMPSKLFKFLRGSKLKRKACSTDTLAGNPNLYNFDDSLKRSPPNPRTFSERRRACSFGEGIHTRYRNGHANGSVDDSISSGNSGSASTNSLLTRRNKAKSYDVIQVTEFEEDFSVPTSPIHAVVVSDKSGLLGGVKLIRYIVFTVKCIEILSHGVCQ